MLGERVRQRPLVRRVYVENGDPIGAAERKPECIIGGEAERQLSAQVRSDLENSL